MTKIFRGTSPASQWQSPVHGVIIDRHKTVIGVKGIGSGSGTTFTAMNLAFELAETAGATEGVTYMEGRMQPPGCCKMSDILSVDPQFRRRLSRGKTNIYKKVNWAAENQDYRGAAGRYIIVDDPEIFDELDLVVAVADPLPSRIEAGIETYRKLRQLQIPVIWIVNKANPQAGIREVESFLKQKFDYRMELLPAEVFYKAEFACTQQYFIQKPRAIEKVAQHILEHNK